MYAEGGDTITLSTVYDCGTPVPGWEDLVETVTVTREENSGQPSPATGASERAIATAINVPVTTCTTPPTNCVPPKNLADSRSSSPGPSIEGLPKASYVMN